VINGGSAGGLLIGAVTNLRPDLFRAVLAEVPFVDVVNTMLDASLPLTVIEYDEWGNPNDPTAYSYIRSYSPYDNVDVKAYPHMLITAGLNDPRVAYWEPAKWTAKLRASKTDNNRLLLRTSMGAGHGGASGRYDSLREVAFKYAFVLDVLGVE
jgi:oligopeptidase B